jgi:uncharacterized protein with PIN domain
MWPFKRKKPSQYAQSRPPCPYCKSSNTKIHSYSQGAEEPNYIKVWRGQRYVTYRCSDCGKEYYTSEPFQGIEDEFLSDESIIDDEDELLAAEEELKRQVDEEDNRRFKQ